LADKDKSVRFPAIVALGQVGASASPLLRAALASEADENNQSALVEALAGLKDAAALQMITNLLMEQSRAEAVRAVALDALARYRGPEVLRARLSVLYDPKAPVSLVARALPPLARDGIIPVNDVATFLDNPAPTVRAAALMSLNIKKVLPPEVTEMVLARLDDPSAEVRHTAIMAIGALKLREAIPQLIRLASRPETGLQSPAIVALCMMPDSRASSIYQRAANDPDPNIARASRAAILAIGEHVDSSLIRSSAGIRTAGTHPPRRDYKEISAFVLAHSGDARKGEELFFENKTLGCSRCHSAGGRGTANAGPDLSGLAQKYSKDELVHSVLQPSDRILPGYEQVLVSTQSGTVITGQIRTESEDTLELLDDELKVTRIPKREVRERRATSVSLMPDGLADSLTPPELTDLVTYLQTLKQH
jgi:putative heme-binding domain-containing protein